MTDIDQADAEAVLARPGGTTFIVLALLSLIAAPVAWLYAGVYMALPSIGIAFAGLFTLFAVIGLIAGIRRNVARARARRVLKATAR